jgi:hypothetical protein
MSDGEFFKVTNVNLMSGMVELDGGARKQMAIFYNRSVHDPKASAEQGRPVYNDRIYVRVAPPGERLNVVDRPATRQDQHIWPIQWAQFEQNQEQTPEGTPIDLLYPEKPAVASTLRANGVLTIEQCAVLSGNAIENIGMGSQTWVNQAQKYVAQSNKGVAITQFRKELEDRDGQIRVLTQQVNQLMTEIQSLRSNVSSSSQLAQLQELIAGAMGRPQMPISGHQNMNASFDVEAAQINAKATERNKPRKQRIKP